MIHGKTFAVIGGDLRSVYLAESIAKNSSNFVYTVYLDNPKLPGIVKKTDSNQVFSKSDIIIFPVPMLTAAGKINTPLYDGSITPEECFEYINPAAFVFGGQISDTLKYTAKEYGINLLDYSAREEFAVMNAVPTAEGALEIAISNLPHTLYGSTCMVAGYGRISKVLIKLLTAFGAKVFVAVRSRSDFAWIKIAGAVPVHFSDTDKYSGNIDVLFNTVPAMIFGSKKLEQLKKDCLVIDLASAPGGIDFISAQRHGIRAIHALALPGKTAPKSAGDIILSTIESILEEKT